MKKIEKLSLNPKLISKDLDVFFRIIYNNNKPVRKFIAR